LIGFLAEEAGLRVVTGIADLDNIAAIQALDRTDSFAEFSDELILADLRIFQRRPSLRVNIERGRYDPSNAVLREAALEILPRVGDRSIIVGSPTADRRA